MEMVDIEVDVLTTTLTKVRNNLQYKVKTTWCQVDIESGNTFVRLPQLQIIDHYLLNKEDTFVFLEIWHKDENSSEAPKFIGFSKCSTKRPLENPKLNPSVQWWEIYDPIQNVVRGKVLLRIDAKFSVKSCYSYPGKILLTGGNESSTLPLLPQPNPASSYFSSKNTDAESQTTLACKEVQTDLSLISLSNLNNNEYKNYNNTTRSNLASKQNTSFTEEDANAVRNICGPNDGIFTKASASRTKTQTPRPNVARPKTSDIKSIEDMNKVKLAQRNIRPEMLPTKSFNPRVSENDISVDNIISLLNDHDVTSDPAALPYRKGNCKSDKNHYNNRSKVDEQSRQAPEGRNEADSDILRSGTINLTSPAKPSKLNGFLAQVPRVPIPIPFRQSYKGQPDHSTHCARSYSADRPPRMAAALSFSLATKQSK